MDAPSPPGTVLVGYRLEAQLGRGPIARVYHATHLARAQPCALKVFQPHRVDPAGLARFHRLAERAAAVPGAHAIPILEVHSDGPAAIVAMPLSPHAPLPRGPVPWGEAVEITRKIARSLAALHRAGLVHGGLKPTNIRATGDPGAGLHLLDVGAYALRGAEDQSATQVHDRLPVDYQAPEQILGESLDPSSDCYALGVILFELLSGRRPFAGKTAEIAYHHVRAAPPPIGREGLPPALERLVQRLLVKADRRRERPQAGEIAEILEPLRQDQDQEPSDECSTQLWSRRAAPTTPPTTPRPASPPSLAQAPQTQVGLRPPHSAAERPARPHDPHDPHDPQTQVGLRPRSAAERPGPQRAAPPPASPHTQVIARPDRPGPPSGQTVLLPPPPPSADSGALTLIPADIGAEFLPKTDTLSGERPRAGHNPSETIFVRGAHPVGASAASTAPRRPSRRRALLAALLRRLRGPWPRRTKALAAVNITCILIVIIGFTLLLADR